MKSEATRAFVVIGSWPYEIFADGTITRLATVDFLKGAAVMVTATAVSYEVEIDKIESDYTGAVKIGAIEADYQKRRDEEQAGINWDSKKPQDKLNHIRILRSNPRRFEMTLTKEEARGFGIGSRVRVTVEQVTT